MEKVHVRRYVAGKRPEWANEVESDSEEEDNKVLNFFDFTSVDFSFIPISMQYALCHFL